MTTVLCQGNYQPHPSYANYHRAATTSTVSTTTATTATTATATNEMMMDHGDRSGGAPNMHGPSISGGQMVSQYPPAYNMNPAGYGVQVQYTTGYGGYAYNINNVNGIPMNINNINGMNNMGNINNVQNVQNVHNSRNNMNQMQMVSRNEINGNNNHHEINNRNNGNGHIHNNGNGNGNGNVTTIIRAQGGKKISSSVTHSGGGGLPLNSQSITAMTVTQTTHNTHGTHPTHNTMHTYTTTNPVLKYGYSIELYNFSRHYKSMIKLAMRYINIGPDVLSPNIFILSDNIKCIVATQKKWYQMSNGKQQESINNNDNDKCKVIGFVVAYPHPHCAPYPDSIWMIGFMATDLKRISKHNISNDDVIGDMLLHMYDLIHPSLKQKMNIQIKHDGKNDQSYSHSSNFTESQTQHTITQELSEPSIVNDANNNNNNNNNNNGSGASGGEVHEFGKLKQKPNLPKGIGIYAPVYHAEAHKLYEHLGFIKIAKISNYYTTDKEVLISLFDKGQNDDDEKSKNDARKNKHSNKNRKNGKLKTPNDDEKDETDTEAEASHTGSSGNGSDSGDNKNDDIVETRKRKDKGKSKEKEKERDKNDKNRKNKGKNGSYTADAFLFCKSNKNFKLCRLLLALEYFNYKKWPKHLLLKLEEEEEEKKQQEQKQEEKGKENKQENTANKTNKETKDNKETKGENNEGRKENEKEKEIEKDKAKEKEKEKEKETDKKEKDKEKDKTKVDEKNSKDKKNENENKKKNRNTPKIVEEYIQKYLQEKRQREKEQAKKERERKVKDAARTAAAAASPVNRQSKRGDKQHRSAGAAMGASRKGGNNNNNNNMDGNESDRKSGRNGNGNDQTSGKNVGAQSGKTGHSGHHGHRGTSKASQKSQKSSKASKVRHSRSRQKQREKERTVTGSADDGASNHSSTKGKKRKHMKKPIRASDMYPNSAGGSVHGVPIHGVHHAYHHSGATNNTSSTTHSLGSNQLNNTYGMSNKTPALLQRHSGHGHGGHGIYVPSSVPNPQMYHGRHNKSGGGGGNQQGQGQQSQQAQLQGQVQGQQGQGQAPQIYIAQSNPNPQTTSPQAKYDNNGHPIGLDLTGVPGFSQSNPMIGANQSDQQHQHQHPPNAVPLVFIDGNTILQTLAAQAQGGQGPVYVRNNQQVRHTPISRYSSRGDANFNIVDGNGNGNGNVNGNVNVNGGGGSVNPNGSAMSQYDDLSQTPVTATQSINGIYPYDPTMTQNQSSLLGQLHGGYNYDSNPNGGLNHNDHNHFASRSHAVFHPSIPPPPGGNMTVNGNNGGGILANISVGGSSRAQTPHISETGTVVTNNSTQITPRSVGMVSNDISYLSDQSGAVIGNRLAGYPYYVAAPNGTVSTMTASMGPPPHHKHGISNGSQYSAYSQGSFGQVQVPSQQQYYAIGVGNLRAHSNVNVNVGDGNDNNGDNNNHNNNNNNNVNGNGYGGPLNGSNGNLNNINNINNMNLGGNNNTSMILHHGYGHSHGHSSHHGKKRVRGGSGGSGYSGFSGMTGPAMSQVSGVTGVSNVSGTTSVSSHHTRNTRSSGHPNNLHKKGHHNQQYYNQKNYYDKQYHQ